MGQNGHEKAGSAVIIIHSRLRITEGLRTEAITVHSLAWYGTWFTVILQHLLKRSGLRVTQSTQNSKQSAAKHQQKPKRGNENIRIGDVTRRCDSVVLLTQVEAVDLVAQVVDEVLDLGDACAVSLHFLFLVDG